MAELFKKKNPDAQAPEVPADGKAPKEKKAKEQKKKYLDPNQMNFLERYETVVEGKQSDVDLSTYKKPIAIILIIGLIAVVIAQGLSIITNASVKSLQKYINDESNIASYNEAVKLKDTIDQTAAQKMSMEAMINAIAAYPDVDRQFFTAIGNAASSNSVAISNYGYAGNTGFLSVSCTAAAPQNISSFVRAMEATGLFASIEYTGFAGASEGGYSFSVSCYCVNGK